MASLRVFRGPWALHPAEAFCEGGQQIPCLAEGIFLEVLHTSVQGACGWRMEANIHYLEGCTFLEALRTSWQEERQLLGECIRWKVVRTSAKGLHISQQVFLETRTPCLGEGKSARCLGLA